MSDDIFVLRTWSDESVRLAALVEVGDPLTGDHNEKWSTTLTVAGRSFSLAALDRNDDAVKPVRVWGFSWSTDCGFIRFWNWEAGF